MRNLLVISDTGMYTKNSDVFCFEPVLIELNYMLQLFNQIYWIGFERKDQINNKSYSKIKSNKIKVKMLPAVGGKRIKDKFKILKSYPYIYKTIHQHIKDIDHIHLRAPSNPALIGAASCFLYPKKTFWFKYAGSWIDKAPFFYSFQRIIFKKLATAKKNVRLTINGDYEDHPRIFNFQNPCINKEDFVNGKKIVTEKKIIDKYKLCFIGNLTSKKGVDNLLLALKTNKSIDHIESIDLIGDSSFKDHFISVSENIEIPSYFHGFLDKKEIFKILSKSHIIILPSQSEGFPKVISEGMNFGCLPVVSAVSCVPQIIQHNKNGFLLYKNTPYEINQVLEQLKKISNIEYYDIVKKNQEFCYMFTYENYIDRIDKEIFV